jgi:hypothetical protein
LCLFAVSLSLPSPCSTPGGGGDGGRGACDDG